MELHKNRLLSQRDELKASISEKRDEIESM